MLCACCHSCSSLISSFFPILLFILSRAFFQLMGYSEEYDFCFFASFKSRSFIGVGISIFHTNIHSKEIYKDISYHCVFSVRTSLVLVFCLLNHFFAVLQLVKWPINHMNCIRRFGAFIQM